MLQHNIKFGYYVHVKSLYSHLKFLISSYGCTNYLVPSLPQIYLPSFLLFVVLICFLSMIIFILKVNQYIWLLWKDQPLKTWLIIFFTIYHLYIFYKGNFLPVIQLNVDQKHPKFNKFKKLFLLRSIFNTISLQIKFLYNY